MKAGGKTYKGKYRKQKKRTGALTKPQKREVAKLIHGQIEDKRCDKVYAYTNQSYNTGLSTPLLLTNGIAQGIDVVSRVGDRITLRSLHLRMSVYHNTSTTVDPQNNYRVIIFKWKLSNMTVPNPSFILQYPSTAIALNYGINSPYSWTLAGEDTFAILYDKSFSLSPNAPTVCHNIRLNKYLGAINFEQSVQTGTGHIYIMVCTDDGLAIAPCPTIGFICRTVFEDA